MTCRLLRVIALLLPLWPTLVLAQQPKAGVVTTLHGVATVARVAAPQEVPLKFKDDVFYKDRISTKESSIVRVLLGGKALVTVRELSVLTISEEPNRATVDLHSGKIALAVARKLMRPGESIEVRTPNAIASVRGTVLIVEMIGNIAIFNVLSGTIAVSLPRVPTAPSVTVNAGESLPVSSTGFGAKGTVSPTAAQGLSAPPQISGPPAETQQQVNNQQTDQATAIAIALLPQQPAGGTYSFLDSKPPSTSNVGVNASAETTATSCTPGTNSTNCQTPNEATASNPPPPPPPAPTDSIFLIQNATVELSAPNSGATFSTGTTQQDPEPGAIICATPPCSPISVTTPLLTATAPTGGSISVSGSGLPVLELKNSSLSASAPLFNVTGTTVETSTLLVMDPSSLTLGDSLLFMDSATLTSASTLFSATGDATGKSTITANGDGVPLVKLLSSTLRLTGAGKSLLSLDHSDLTVKGSFLSGTDSTVEVNGPLLNLKNGSTATNSVGPVIKLSGGSLMADALATSDGNGNALNVTGPVLDLSGTTVQLGSLLGPSGVEAIGFTLAPGDPLARLWNSHLSLTQSGVSFLILPSGTVLNVSGTGTSLVSLDHSEMTVVGPFIQAVAADITVSGPVARLTNGSTLRNTMGPVFSLSGGSLTADALGISDDTGNTFDLTGTLLDLSNGASVTLRTLGEEVPNNHTDTVNFNLATHEPLIKLSSSHLTLTGAGKELVGFGVDTGTPITQNGVALIATGTAAMPSTISLKGRLLDLGGVNLTDSQAQIQLSHTTVTQTGSDPLIDVLGLPVTMAGPLLYVGGGTNTITAGGPILHFGTGSFTSNTTDDFIETGAGDTIKSRSNFARLDAGASVTLKGTFLNASGSTLCSGSTSTPCSAGGSGAFINVTGGASLTQTGILQDNESLGRPPLISLSGGNVTAGGNFLNVTGTGSNVSLAGTLLSSNGATITAGNNLVRIRDGGSLSSGATDHLLLFTGGSFTGGGTFGTASGGSLLRMFSEMGQPGTSLTLTGPYLGSSGGTTFLSKDAPLFNITDGASINAGSDFALFGTGSATSAFSLFRLETNTSFTQPGQPTTFGSGAPATVNIHGTLIGGANFTFTTQHGGDFLTLRNGVTLDQTGTASALVALTGTNPGDASVTAGGHFLSMSAASSSPTLKLGGSLLSAVNASLTNGDPTANVRSFLLIADSATLTGPSNQPLLSFSGSSLDTAGAILALRRSRSPALPSTLTLSGPLLVATDLGLTQSTFNTTSLGFGPDSGVAGASCCDGFFVAQGALLTAATGSSLIQLTNSTFNAGLDPQSGGRFFEVSDRGPDGIVAPASVTLGNSTVTAGSLLTATNSTITALFDLVSVRRSSLTTNSASPLVQLFGGTLTLGGVDPFTGLPAAAAVFDLKGSATQDETVEVEGLTLTLGKDQPLRQNLADGVTADPQGFKAPLLQTTDATVTAPKALKIDTALLVATAPLFNFLKGSGAGSNVTFTNADPNSGALDLSMKAKVASLGSALVKLDGSSVTVNNGHFVNVAGGSLLSVAGDLVHLMNGSSLTINNGTLLSVSGGSVVTINGFFIRFTGPQANTIKVTNNLAPTFFNGIPVFLAPGVVLGNNPAVKELGDTAVISIKQNAINGMGGGNPSQIKINGTQLPNNATSSSGITGSLIAVNPGTTTQPTTLKIQ